MDDCTIAGEEEFIKGIVKGISEKFTVSKIEENEFRVTENKEIRKVDRNEKLTKLELKEYRKYTEKISWLSQGTRPDLSYSALQWQRRIIVQQ